MDTKQTKVRALLDALIEIAEDGEKETLTEQEKQYWFNRYGVDNLDDLKEEYLMDKYGAIGEETPDFSFEELKLSDAELETLRPIMDPTEKPCTLSNADEKDPLPF